MPDPLILALDTSTRYASVALARGSVLLGEYTWQAGTNHTRQLLPVTKAVLQENDVGLSEVGLIALAAGPGSFNGLRVGMATAKAFASTLGVPLVTAGTLEVEAYAHAAFPGPICPVHDAGRGELAWAIYRRHNRAWSCLAAPQITPPARLGDSVEEETLFCGELPGWALEGLSGRLGHRLVLAGTAASVRRASLLAELAWARFQAGEQDDVAQLQPLYLRRPPGGGA